MFVDMHFNVQHSTVIHTCCIHMVVVVQGPTYGKSYLSKYFNMFAPDLWRITCVTQMGLLSRPVEDGSGEWGWADLLLLAFDPLPFLSLPSLVKWRPQ